MTNLFFQHTFGTPRPRNTEIPKTKRFLAEPRSTYCSVDTPTAVIIANMTTNTPATTGSGTVTNSAPNLPNIPHTIMMTALYWTTRRLPTYGYGVAEGKGVRGYNVVEGEGVRGYGVVEGKGIRGYDVVEGKGVRGYGVVEGKGIRGYGAMVQMGIR